MAWKNFSIWRGRLPHWRADDVTYYATFRHRRELDETECDDLFKSLVRLQGRKFQFVILSVLPEKSEMLFTVGEKRPGENYELSDLLEKAKAKAGKAIVTRTGERFPPFFNECFDRIVRDEAELEERFLEILQGPVSAGLGEPEDYPTLWVPPN